MMNVTRPGRVSLVRTLAVLAACLGAVLPALAQTSEFQPVAIELRGGVTQPQVAFVDRDVEWEPGTAASLGASLVLRAQRHFGFDVGFDWIPGAFGATGTINTTGGRRRIGDRELLFTFGPRLIAATSDDRVLFSFGGGYAYARYDEVALAQANETITGFRGGSRTGTGGYVFGQLEAATSATSPVTVGVRVGAVFAETTGTRVGDFPGGYKTRDTWPTVVGTIGFRFGG